MDEIPKTFYRVSIKALILDETRKKFAVVRQENGWWELPGGGLDWPEKPEECLRRELHEEMGLVVTEVSSTPAFFLVGENLGGWRSINVLFETKVEDFNFVPSHECLEMRFVSPEEVDSINTFRNVKELAVLFNNQNT